MLIYLNISPQISPYFTVQDAHKVIKKHSLKR